MRVVLRSVAVSFSAVALLAGPAAAAQNHAPVRFWRISRIDQGAGEVPLDTGSQIGGKVQEAAQLGLNVFNLPLHAPYWYFLPRDHAFGSLFSNDTGKQYSVLAQAPVPNPMRIGQPKGGISHLDEFQAYEKRAGDASLKITLSDLLLQTVDDNNRLGAWECPDQGTCDPVRTVVRFHARAYAASAGGDFFDTGGVAYLEGHQRSWRPGAATSSDAPKPLWGEGDFGVDGDADDSKTGAVGVMFINHAIRVRVPLGAVRERELFAVHVTLEAEAVDDRGGESGAQAFIQDPQKRAPLLLTSRGLKERGKPRFKEPRLRELKPASCPGGRPRRSGTLQLTDSGFSANESSSSPMVLVSRTGGSHGSASVTLTTHSGTARAGRDFTQTTTTVRFADGDTSPRLVEIPLREDRQAEPAETFTVSLGHARCAGLGRHRATVTLVDDDLEAPASPPQPEFTIGGTVDGLSGSGLVLTSLGDDLPVSANGSFALPGTRSAGATYDVEVRAQPHNPDQVCTVEHGRGTVTANVTDVAVHCITPLGPTGLDPTFAGGRVSTPVGGSGHGEAVVIQPGGGIVTAGWRNAGAADFVLTRHDANGNFDHDFGTAGIAVTDFGGNDDEAYDAAPTPDGGIVAVGRTNAAGPGKVDFAVARYTPAGKPENGFDGDGKVMTGVLGDGAQANAVAVQPDGEIVVAGSAERDSIDGDFALVRYKTDGTLDDDFGTHGKVTTDLGTQFDSAKAIVIQPDGKIVVAGAAGEDVGLARYTDKGTLDTTFGNMGTTVTPLASEHVANGVALSPDGHILVAGYTLGPHVNRDFMLARYTDKGALDTAFGDHGFVLTDVLGADDFAESLAVDANGRIVVVGRAVSSTISDMALLRYTPQGTPDTTFDGDGKLTADFHGSGEFGQDVALDSAGRVVAAGYTSDGADTEFALLRANP